MSNSSWIVIGLFLVVLAVGISIYLYQDSKNTAAQIEANKLAVLNSSIGNTLAQGHQQAGVGGWLSGILNTALTVGAPIAAGATKTGLV